MEMGGDIIKNLQSRAPTIRCQGISWHWSFCHGTSIQVDSNLTAMLCMNQLAA